VTFRLLEAPAFKEHRRRRGEPLVLVVSGDIYRSVVWHGYPGIDRDAYRQLFRVRVAGQSHQGWVRTARSADRTAAGPALRRCHALAEP
jgi:hypothetical protein